MPDEGSVSEDRSVPPSPEDRDSGLFMLKKDSERRAILYKVLNEDQEKVISNLRENHMQVCVCLLVLYIEWRYKSGSTSTLGGYCCGEKGLFTWANTMTQLSWKTQFNVLVIKVVALSPGNKSRS